MKAKVNHRRVESAVISSIAYVPLAAEYREKVPGSGFVVIRFKNGPTFAYLVPSWTYGLLVGAKSPGRVYNRLIKDKGLPGVKL